jgi:D-amino-acid oxidase
MARVIVVGAGVVGLTCAVRLLESGHRVDIVARDLPLETTSAIAAAFWYPYRALPQDRVSAWASASYAEYVGLAGDPDTGVRMVTGTEVHRERQRNREGAPWWRAPAQARASMRDAGSPER